MVGGADSKGGGLCSQTPSKPTILHMEMELVQLEAASSLTTMKRRSLSEKVKDLSSNQVHIKSAYICVYIFCYT